LFDYSVIYLQQQLTSKEAGGNDLYTNRLCMAPFYEAHEEVLVSSPQQRTNSFPFSASSKASLIAPAGSPPTISAPSLLLHSQIGIVMQL